VCCFDAFVVIGCWRCVIIQFPATPQFPIAIAIASLSLSLSLQLTAEPQVAKAAITNYETMLS
jgi:hypothetical protein